MKKQKGLKKPFFSNFLENQLNKSEQESIQGGLSATHKYPSDGDDPYTNKYPSDQEDAVTEKYPSDGDDSTNS
jgi:serine endopeptidase inhibitor I10-like protein